MHSFNLTCAFGYFYFVHECMFECTCIDVLCIVDVLYLTYVLYLSVLVRDIDDNYLIYINNTLNIYK